MRGRGLWLLSAAGSGLLTVAVVTFGMLAQGAEGVPTAAWPPMPDHPAASTMVSSILESPSAEPTFEQVSPDPKGKGEAQRTGTTTSRQAFVDRTSTTLTRALEPLPVRVAQANIKVSDSDASFQSDLAKVLAEAPDFITLNEVHSRSDDQISPPGYASYRSADSKFTRETPVLWRTADWEAVSVGTRYLSTRNVKWGIRAVNWVTARNLHTGQVVTVVSAHPAPTIPQTQGLLPEFTSRLGSLVTELNDSGPVIVGGDFNAGYLGHLYPKGALDAYGLTPTYTTFGAPGGGTGDHGGSTIDYLFYQPGHGLTPVSEGKAELASDHDAIWATFILAPAAAQ